MLEYVNLISRHHFLERLSLPHQIALAFYLKLIKLTMNVAIYFGILSSIPLAYKSIPIPVHAILITSSFMVTSEII